MSATSSPTPTPSITASDASSSCAPTYLGSQDSYHALRIAAIFIIMISSALGAFFPVLAKRTLKLPGGVYEFAKYFGSGVIIATGFIHLLSPGFAELGSPCLAAIWQVYPWPAAISMASVFFIFFIELFAFRWGTARINRYAAKQQLGDEAGNVMRSYDPHGHGLGSEGAHAAHGPEPSSSEPIPIVEKKTSNTDLENKSSSSSTSGMFDPDAHKTSLETHPLGQILSVVILEFGVLFHSFIVGLTLAVSNDFIPLLCVLVFHQLFEGLGLGTRLAYLTIFTSKLKRYALFPYFGALFFSLSTPIGIAIGLGVQKTYAPDSNTANIVSGVFDSFSSGILLYTGLVELLAHEFLFSKTMMEKSTGSVAYAGFCVLLGAGLMALLGRWA